MTAKVLKSRSVVSPEAAAAAADAIAAAEAVAYEAGRQDGLVEGGALLAAEANELSHHISTLGSQTVADAIRAMEADVERTVALARDLAEWFIATRLASEGQLVGEAVAEAMAGMVEEHSLVVSVAPAIAELLEANGGVDGAALRPDPALGPGDFQVVGSGSVVERVWVDVIADLTPELATVMRTDIDDR